MIVLFFKALSVHTKFFFGRKLLKRCNENSSCGTERPEIEKKQERNSLKSPPFQAWHWDRIRHRSGQQHTCIYPQPLTPNSNTKCIHQYGRIFCMHWQLFNSYSSQFRWADSLPLPIEVKWYEQLNINDWGWLIDPPTRRPPQTDRDSDRRMHPSPCFLTFHSVSLPSVPPSTHSVKCTYPIQSMQNRPQISPRTCKLCWVWCIIKNTPF